MTEPVTFDAIWEEKYASGHAQRYPWDVVVSFVFRHAPRDRPCQEVAILEVGCGTASNLWFAAREGFSVAGIDGSASAIDYAKKRFAEDKLEGDLRVGDFTKLDFPDNSFDCIIDRGALTCCGHSALKRALAEVRRVLKPGGHFFFNPYADSHSSARAGKPAGDGLVKDIDAGSLVGAGQIHFVGHQQLIELMATGWSLHQIQRLELTDMVAPEGSIHAEWRVIAQKTS
ncbi:class I SAM-dependent methyltransferase [Pelagibius sp.]|uniref:class I SAM-dependent methyltransferase n=1 Tax=Pelagibius sp. TaxID=1931238 RepID=UPI003BB1AEC0